MALGVHKLDTKGVPAVSDGVGNAAEGGCCRGQEEDHPTPPLGFLGLDPPAFPAPRSVYAAPKIHAAAEKTAV